MGKGKSLYNVSHIKDGDSGGADDMVLSENTRLSVPLWLAIRLKTIGKKAIHFDFPSPIYCNELLFALKAAPEAVNLRQHSAYYFEIGLRHAFIQHRLAKDDSEAEAAKWVMHLLQVAALARWTGILKHLGNGGALERPNSVFVQKLTLWEERIFFHIRNTEIKISSRIGKAQNGYTDWSKRRKIRLAD